MCRKLPTVPKRNSRLQFDVSSAIIKTRHYLPQPAFGGKSTLEVFDPFTPRSQRKESPRWTLLDHHASGVHAGTPTKRRRLAPEHL
jgi:hypothetical protein